MFGEATRPSLRKTLLAEISLTQARMHGSPPTFLLPEGEAAVVPPGGFQSAGHRRCANGVPNSFQTGSVQSQLANLDILSSSSFAQFDLKCSFPYPFLSPGAWGPPQTRRQKAEKFGFFAFLVDFFAFRTALEK